MAQEYRLKDITSLASIRDFDKVESEVEGIEGGKVLVLRVNGQVYCLSPKCTHYGAPLKLGVVSPDGRLTCPWHGGASSLDAFIMCLWNENRRLMSCSVFQYPDRRCRGCTRAKCPGQV